MGKSTELAKFGGWLQKDLAIRQQRITLLRDALDILHEITNPVVQKAAKQGNPIAADIVKLGHRAAITAIEESDRLGEFEGVL